MLLLIKTQRRLAELTLEDRMIVCNINPSAQEEAHLLDGCYVIVTDVAATVLNKEQVQGPSFEREIAEQQSSLDST